jgi:hypothetical protein
MARRRQRNRSYAPLACRRPARHVYSVAERRPAGQRPPRRRVAVVDRSAVRVAGRVAFEVGEGDVVRWGEQLAGLRWPPRGAGRVCGRVRCCWGWGAGGSAGGSRSRFATFGGELRGVLRYAPSHDRAPKMLGARSRGWWISRPVARMAMT